LRKLEEKLRKGEVADTDLKRSKSKDNAEAFSKIIIMKYNKNNDNNVTLETLRQSRRLISRATSKVNKILESYSDSD